jgi:hypothetical protein
VRRLILALTALLVAACQTAGGSSSAPPPGRTSLPAGRTGLVWAVGDGNASSQSARLVRVIRASRPQRFLYLGDVYPNGSAGDFADNYASTYGRLAPITDPTPGNHDAGPGYFAYWHRPAYYAFRASGWEILSLNSETPHGPRSPQLRWLRARLRGGGDCRLAFWHRPRYSAGAVHGDQRDVAPFWHALRGRARLVLNGHEHDSQRLRPVAGITEIVAGAGGNDLYPVRRDYPGLAFADARHYAALRLRFRPGVARYAFVTEAGRTLERGQVRCARPPR